jgi:hypothetical protein
MNRAIIGFVWRHIPVVSQYKLENGYGPEDTFLHWSQKVIDDYENQCAIAARECETSKAVLTSLGCTEVVVSPDATGSLRLVLFDRLLAELPPYTFLMVTSWDDLGKGSVLVDYADRALTKKVFVVTPNHLSLNHMPDDVLVEAYKNLVRPQIAPGTHTQSKRSSQIAYLLAQGLTATEVQERLKISKSTYYRLMADGTAKLLADVIYDFDNKLNNPQ